MRIELKILDIFVLFAGLISGWYYGPFIIKTVVRIVGMTTEWLLGFGTNVYSVLGVSSFSSGDARACEIHCFYLKRRCIYEEAYVLFRGDCRDADQPALFRTFP